MRSVFSGRGRRVAACTALALTAGMLLAAPVSAREPVPGPALLKQVPPSSPAPAREAAAHAGTLAEVSSAPLSDLDGDGVEDLLFRWSDGNLYTQSGAARESTPLFELNREGIARDVVAIGDQGGAGTAPEVLVLSEDGTLTLYADAALTGSATAHRVGGGWQAYNKITTPGDVNGDGRADVLARTPDGQLYLYLATGDLARPLGARTLVGGGWGVYDQLVGAGDGNGDGRADLYARDTTGALWWYAGTGDTAKPFGTRRLIGRGWGTYVQILRSGGGGLWARDGESALFHYAARGDGTLNGRVLTDGGGTWTETTQFAGAGNIPYTGREEFIARDDIGTLYRYDSTATGHFFPPVEYSYWGGWKGLTWTAVSSLDADGVADVVQVASDGVLYADMVRIGGGWGVYNTLVGPGDLSGDGKTDLLARDKSGVLYLYKGNGQGTAFAARIRVGSGWGVYNRLLGAGDYTGDGRTDLLARTAGGDLYLYPGTGNATTPFKTRIHIGGGWNTYRLLAAPGDLNADGKADLIGIDTDGSLFRYYGSAAGRFSGRFQLGSGYEIYDSMS